jgi:uncharacterized protein
MSETGSAQVHLAPLLRAEVLYLLGETSVGFVMCAQGGMTTRRPGFHAAERGAIVILTLMSPELESMLENGLPVTYATESVNETTSAGWHATVTGPADVIVDPALHAHYQRVLPSFEPCHGTRVLRLRPHLVTGNRFHRLTAAL